MASTTPDHSDRGFARFEPIATSYGHILRVYESSAASGPHLWLSVDADSAANGDHGHLAAHLTLEQTATLRDHLTAAIDGHYQRES